MYNKENGKLYNRFVKHNFKAISRAINDYFNEPSRETRADLIDAVRNKISKISKGLGWFQYAVFYDNGTLSYKVGTKNIDIYIGLYNIYIDIDNNQFNFKISLNDTFKILDILKLIDRYYNNKENVNNINIVSILN